MRNQKKKIQIDGVEVESDKDIALSQIAKVLNGLPSVTHGEVTPDLDSILFAIRDLQECYKDAARVRNGWIKKENK